MYERKIPIDMTCGIKLVMEALSGKWKCCILLDLQHGAKRPSEIIKMYPEANPRVISLQLRELTDYGFIEKKIFAELPPHSEYALTDLGRSIIPLLKQLDEWGVNLRPRMKELFGED